MYYIITLLYSIVMSDKYTPALPMEVLTIGIDASGKSTFLDGLTERFNFTVIEPTSSDQARSFKRRTIDSALSDEIITAREELYLDLNNVHAGLVNAAIKAGSRVATTGSSLVTRLSHAVMRQTTTIESDARHHIRVVRNELSQTDLPDTLCFTHAPFSVIRDRITGRQAAGNTLERFWGFNSLFFLDRYQDAWHEAAEVIQAETDIECITFDTSTASPDEMLDEFTSRAGVK